MSKLFWSIAITWGLANALKFIIAWIRLKRIDLRELAGNGGMPSGHTSLVASAATALFLQTGFSPYFIIMAIVAILVMYDATQVRSIIGEHSRIINEMKEKEEGFKRLDEQVGHSTSEVLISLALGIIIPLAIYKLF